MNSQLNFKLEKISAVVIFLILLSSILSAASRKGWLISDIKEAFKYGAGNRALPDEVVAMNLMATKFQIQNFRLSEEIAGDALIHQRAVEFLYPNRMVNSSDYIFASKKDMQFVGCHLLDQVNDIVLQKCKN